MSKTFYPQTKKQYGLKPKKIFGQNFLVSGGILKKIINAIEIKKSDIVLEIGPGTGNLTFELAKKAKKVLAVEKDKDMVLLLKKNLAEKKIKNVEVLEKDILKIRVSDLLRRQNLRFKKYKLVGNIPYYITAPIIRKFLEEKNKPQSIVFTVQKEVAQRICSKPPKMNLLAVSVQFYSEPKIIQYVKKGSFWPVPKVDSAIIKIMSKKRVGKNDAAVFFKVAKAGFSHPRKQLAGNLSKEFKIPKEKIEEILKKIGIKPEQRAETLSVDDWKHVAANIAFL